MGVSTNQFSNFKLSRSFWPSPKLLPEEEWFPTTFIILFKNLICVHRYCSLWGSTIPPLHLLNWGPCPFFTSGLANLMSQVALVSPPLLPAVLDAQLDRPNSSLCVIILLSVPSRYGCIWSTFVMTWQHCLRWLSRHRNSHNINLYTTVEWRSAILSYR